MFSIFQKHKQLNIDKDEFELILTKLNDCLLRNKNVAQAKWIQKIKSALRDNDQRDLLDKLTSVDMWGGSGAVWEVGFNSDLDDREFILEIVKLTELMKKSGIKSRAAESRGRSLKRIYGI